MSKRPKPQEIITGLLASPEFAGRLGYIEDWARFIVLNSNSRHWQMIDNDDIQNQVAAFVRVAHSEIPITRNLLADLILNLKQLVPIRLSCVSMDYIAFRDTLLDLRTLEPVDFSPDRHPFHYLPVNFRDIKHQSSVHFRQFLQSTLVDGKNRPDPYLYIAMMEMFGSFLLPSTHLSTAFFLVGEGANGKSVMAKAISDVFGEEYVSSYSIESLTTNRFASSGLVGKLANICNEEESKFIRSDKFKALVSGDSVTAERKFGAPFQFQPTVKFLFCTNRMPVFDGVNYGLTRRIRIIPFRRRFGPGERDVELSAKIAEERAAVIHFALEGARRLRYNNMAFSVGGEQMDEMMSEFEGSVSSAVAYFRENWEVSDESQGAWVSAASLYERYRAWCTKTGCKPKKMITFGQDIQAVLPETQTIVRWENGRPERGRWLSPTETSTEDTLPDRESDKIANIKF